MNYPYYSNYRNPYYMQQPIQQPIQQPMQQIGLQGKIIDNAEVVKAIDIPLDCSVSYFPLADNSAIYTKQLQIDGSSKIICYVPQINVDKQEKIEYTTLEDFNKSKNELKELKKQIETLNKEIETLKENKTKKGDK